MQDSREKGNIMNFCVLWRVCLRNADKVFLGSNSQVLATSNEWELLWEEQVDPIEDNFCHTSFENYPNLFKKKNPQNGSITEFIFRVVVSIFVGLSYRLDVSECQLVGSDFWKRTILEMSNNEIVFGSSNPTATLHSQSRPKFHQHNVRIQFTYQHSQSFKYITLYFGLIFECFRRISLWKESCDLPIDFELKIPYPKNHSLLLLFTEVSHYWSHLTYQSIYQNKLHAKFRQDCTNDRMLD